jgi:hypothetical protein
VVNVAFTACSFCTFVACIRSSAWFQNADPPDTSTPELSQTAQLVQLVHWYAAKPLTFHGFIPLSAVTATPLMNAMH